MNALPMISAGHRWLLLAGLSALAAAGPAAHAALKTDESVTLYPALAWPANDGWRIELHGVVFESGTHSAQVAVFEKLLGLDRDEFGEDERQLFRTRIEWFLVDNERDKQLILDGFGQEIRPGKTGENGRFRAEILFERSAAASGGVTERGGTFSFPVGVRAASGPARNVVVPVHFIPDEGWSVVSDIDDTIKVSHVRDTKAMIRATFCRPFEAVPGMAEKYRQWAGAGTGVRFHYVSASPWQLYPALNEFVSSNAFPAGTFHLKTIRLKDSSVLQLFGEQTGYKRQTIEGLLTRFPRRQFIFVGDSGEQDPEIYGEIARRYSKQVRHVWIRNVTSENAAAPRYQAAFRELDPALWTIFDEPAVLPARFR